MMHRRAKRHGTESEYRRGCKCELCVAAGTAAREERRRRNETRARLERADADLAALQKIPAVKGMVADVPAELYTAYVEARRAVIAAEAVQALAELELKQAIGSASVVKVNGRIVATWENHTRRFFNVGAFKVKHPALYEKFMTATAPRSFRPVAFAASIKPAAKGGKR